METPPIIAGPEPSHLTRPFWEAAAAGRLVLQYDPAAERYQFYPRPISVHSGRAELEWRAASGRGRVASFTRVQQGKSSWLLAGIDLEEGVRLLAPLVNLAPDAARIGLDVRVAWITEGRARPLIAFEPAP